MQDYICRTRAMCVGIPWISPEHRTFDAPGVESGLSCLLGVNGYLKVTLRPISYLVLHIMKTDKKVESRCFFCSHYIIFLGVYFVPYVMWWLLVGQGAKLFYLSGVIHGEYQKTEVRIVLHGVPHQLFRVKYTEFLFLFVVQKQSLSPVVNPLMLRESFKV